MQTIASQCSVASPDTSRHVDKLTAGVLALTDAVSVFLRCAASLIGRAVIDERYLSGHLMQHCTGALANLAHYEQLRPLFADVFPEAKAGAVTASPVPAAATSRGQPMCQVLLDLCRLPVPPVRVITVSCVALIVISGYRRQFDVCLQSEHWTVVRGSALAALCNAALGQPTVMSALRNTGAVNVLLDILEGRSVKSGIACA